MTKLQKLAGRAGLVAAVGLAAGSAAANNLVVNGDFSGGTAGFTTGYGYSTLSPAFQGGVHGIYIVTSTAPGNISSQSAYGDWTNINSDPFGGTGNAFVADGATDPNVVVWSETVTVKPNTNYSFSYYAAEVSNPCCSNASFQPSINGALGAVLNTTGSWLQSPTWVWNSGLNTSAVLTLVDTNTSGPFNDFALTDISFSSAVPEPAAWAMLILGLGLVGLAARRRGAAVAA